MYVQIMNFINNYQARWFLADFAFASDILANGIWGSKCYEIFAVFGIQASSVQTGIAALELIRIGVLLYERGVQRQTDSVKSGSLENKQDGAENK